MMKNIIEKFQICLVLSALLFSSFVAACSGNDDTVPPAVVSGVSVNAGVKQIIVSFNPNTTDLDFLKYRIYYNDVL